MKRDLKQQMRKKLLGLLPRHELDSASNLSYAHRLSRPYLEEHVLANWTDETLLFIIDYARHQAEEPTK